MDCVKKERGEKFQWKKEKKNGGKNQKIRNWPVKCEWLMQKLQKCKV